MGSTNYSATADQIWDHAFVSAVYVFEVEDALAGCWSSQIAVLGESQSAAYGHLRKAGLRKRQINHDGRVVTSAPNHSEPFSSLTDGRFMRRRLEIEGWTTWDLVPSGSPLNWRLDPARPRTG